MTDDDFWALIGGLHGKAEPEGIAALTEDLSHGPTDRIESFAEHLAAALYALDSRERMTQPIRDTADGPDSPAFPLSNEVFLYARCAVVAAGRELWQRVVEHPEAMSDTWDLGAEELLYVAPVAFEHKTGSDWTFQTSVGYQTGSNEAGWQ